MEALEVIELARREATFAKGYLRSIKDYFGSVGHLDFAIKNLERILESTSEYIKGGRSWE